MGRLPGPILFTAALIAAALGPLNEAAAQSNPNARMMAISAANGGVMPPFLQAQAIQGYLDGQIRQDLLARQVKYSGTTLLRPKATLVKPNCSGPERMTLKQRTDELKAMDGQVLAWAYSGDQAVFADPIYRLTAENFSGAVAVGLPTGYNERQAAALAKLLFLQELQISKMQKANSTNRSPAVLQPPATARALVDLASFYYKAALAMTTVAPPPMAQNGSTVKVSLRVESITPGARGLDVTRLHAPGQWTTLVPGPSPGATSAKAPPIDAAQKSTPLSTQALHQPAARKLAAAVVQTPTPAGKQQTPPSSYYSLVSTPASSPTTTPPPQLPTADAGAAASGGATPPVAQALDQASRPTLRNTDFGPQ
jgi:hypothetical protein